MLGFIPRTQILLHIKYITCYLICISELDSVLTLVFTFVTKHASHDYMLESNFVCYLAPFAAFRGCGPSFSRRRCNAGVKACCESAREYWVRRICQWAHILAGPPLRPGASSSSRMCGVTPFITLSLARVRRPRECGTAALKETESVGLRLIMPPARSELRTAS
ncbi:hypothetical protein EVAR_9032_1 [Eumeta japonica]|uniref:Uncharacterized protein n=1 Tax=Eumeta variegata TaxID=151549 RepID=A0A4C1TW14_EUMVA|nr:hypothetical protein EVAR_9032_1 [Eumeta japonica]